MFRPKTISDGIFTVLQMILQESKRSPLGSFESAGNAISKRVEGLKYQICYCNWRMRFFASANFTYLINDLHVYKLRA